MMDDELTERDREYMRAVFLLNGKEEPVGPSKLSEKMGVSKVGVLRKMKRIARLGMGDYIEQNGLLLNSEGVKVVERDIENHHIIEYFLQKSLDMDFPEACEESSKMGEIISDTFIESVREKMGDEISCECGLCLDPPYSPSKLKECHWCNKMFKEEKS